MSGRLRPTCVVTYVTTVICQLLNSGLHSRHHRIYPLLTASRGSRHGYSAGPPTEDGSTAGEPAAVKRSLYISQERPAGSLHSRAMHVATVLQLTRSCSHRNRQSPRRSHHEGDVLVGVKPLRTRKHVRHREAPAT